MRKEIEVEESVDSIVVTAISKNNKITGDGILKLEAEENVFKITVTGKRTSKTYTLNVKKMKNVSDTPSNDEASAENAFLMEQIWILYLIT